MNIEKWVEIYKPIHNISGSTMGFCLQGDDCIVHDVCDPDMEAVRSANPHCVWTLLDVDGTAYVVSGLHFVNREGYLITTVPHAGEFIEIPVFDDDVVEDMVGYVVLEGSENQFKESIESRIAQTLSCHNGCTLWKNNGVKPYFVGGDFSHYYCDYCGDSVNP